MIPRLHRAKTIWKDILVGGKYLLENLLILAGFMMAALIVCHTVMGLLVWSFYDPDCVGRLCISEGLSLSDKVTLSISILLQFIVVAWFVGRYAIQSKNKVSNKKPTKHRFSAS